MKSRDRTFNISRRLVLKKGMLVVAGVAVAGTLLRSPGAAAAGKASKSTMMYMDKPHGNQDCSNCIHFVPGAKKSADGTCTVVEGSISPHGWCVAYGPKS